MACDLIDFKCKAVEGAKEAVGGAIDDLATDVLDALGTAVASLGTLWVSIGTPVLTGSGETEALAGAGQEQIDTVMGYLLWISLIVAVVSLFLLGGIIASHMRRGQGLASVGRIGIVLVAVVLISGSSALVAGLMPRGPADAGGTTAFLQSSLWYYMGAAVVVSVIIGGVRMAWEQRAEPGKELLKSLLTLIVVAGAGTTIVSLLVAAGDAFSTWILANATDCDLGADSSCFGRSVAAMLGLAASAGSLGALLVIILGTIAILASFIQILMMVARSAMLVLLTGFFPLASSATNTEMGRSWFKKCVAWLVAFILYKPVAAIVYATAFQLVGSDVFNDDGTGLIAVGAGMMLMILALFALPALMRFVTPMVGSMSGGGGAVAGVAAAAALPTGAALSRGMPGGGGGSSSAGAPSASASPSGGNGSPGPTGPTGGDGTTGGSGTSKAGTSGSGAGPTGGGAAASGVGAATSAGGVSGSGATSVGGGAAVPSGGGAAASGSAAGPAGMTTGAAVGAAAGAAQKAGQAAQQFGSEATGEGETPSGSN